MKKQLLIFAIIVFFFQDMTAFDFSGIWLLDRWYVDSKYCSLEQTSWGIDYFPRNSLEIMIDEGTKRIEISGMGRFEIKTIEKLTETEHILTFYFDRGNFDVQYKFILQNGREFILENLTQSTHFVSEGDMHRYYRKSGPTDVEQYNKPIYALYKGEKKKIELLGVNDKIRLIGLLCSYKGFDDKNGLKYWFVNEKNEYGYVNVNSVQLIDE